MLVGVLEVDDRDFDWCLGDLGDEVSAGLLLRGDGGGGGRMGLLIGLVFLLLAGLGGAGFVVLEDIFFVQIFLVFLVSP